MFQPVSPLGNRPCARPTRQLVCKLVTPTCRNAVSYLLPFQYVAHSFENENSATHVFSEGSALFGQNTGGSYIPHDLSVLFNALRTPQDFSGTYATSGSFPASLFPRIPASASILRRHLVGTPLRYDGKCALSLFSSCHYKAPSLPIKVGTPLSLAPACFLAEF